MAFSISHSMANDFPAISANSFALSTERIRVAIKKSISRENTGRRRDTDVRTRLLGCGLS